MKATDDSDIKERFSSLLDPQRWGRIVQATEEVPGVFHLATRDIHHPICREIYAAATSSIPSIISKETCSYGQVYGELHLFEYGVEHSGWDLVWYEIQRYRVKSNRSIYPDSLYSNALYAAEKYPNYFGGVVPPRCTPDGMVLRTKKAAEGIFFLETEHCRWMLAVSYPVWECDLSDYAQSLGQFSNHDLQLGINEAKFLYFSESACAPALYELLVVKEYGGLMAFLSSREILETKLHIQFPEYVIQHNTLELFGHGRGDILREVLSAFGYNPPAMSEDEIARDRERRIANCIHLTPGLEHERLLDLPL